MLATASFGGCVCGELEPARSRWLARGPGRRRLPPAAGRPIERAAEHRDEVAQQLAVLVLDLSATLVSRSGVARSGDERSRVIAPDDREHARRSSRRRSRRARCSARLAGAAAVAGVRRRRCVGAVASSGCAVGALGASRRARRAARDRARTRGRDRNTRARRTACRRRSPRARAARGGGRGTARCAPGTPTGSAIAAARSAASCSCGAQSISAAIARASSRERSGASPDRARGSARRDRRARRSRGDRRRSSRGHVPSNVAAATSSVGRARANGRLPAIHS